MKQRHGISIAVLSTEQDDVELVNRTLRDAGHAAHCHWVEQPGKLDKLLKIEPLELIILNKDNYPDRICQVIRQKDAYLPEVPVIAIQNEVDESHILQAMNDGACDLVSMEKKDRLRAVVARELRAIRVERALNTTLISATEYRKQLKDYMHDSSSAIAEVQEGIITAVNTSWVELFNTRDGDDLVGMPLMDLFAAESHAAVKGALVATASGKWQTGETLLANSRTHNVASVELPLSFRLIKIDDGSYVQIRISPRERKQEDPTKLVHEALKRDPTTLFLHRAQFIERMTKRISSKPKSGLHAVAFIKIDDFSDIRKQVGQIACEEIIALFAEEVRKRLHPRDVAGRFEGTVLMALLERGNERDAAVWGQQLVDHMQEQEFALGKQRVKLTCTVGVCGVSGLYENMEELVTAVASAYRTAKSKGGNCVYLDDSSDQDTRQRKYDAIWVKHIESALANKRFRLAQLPIAGLRSSSENMFDMLVRMIDEQGNAILPSEFLPAAERNNLMPKIDRWILSATVDYCADYPVDRAFVRLSRQSMQDPELLDWVRDELEKRSVDPGKICFQIPEQEAAKFIKQAKKTVLELRELGIAFALEHYRVDQGRFQILDMLKPNYIKIDGELMHALITDTALQESVRTVTEAAAQRRIQTIAERVENANAMAVLFQLGVDYMQGHYVQEPEVVLQETVNTVHTTLEAIASG